MTPSLFKLKSKHNNGVSKKVMRKKEALLRGRVRLVVQGLFFLFVLGIVFDRHGHEVGVHLPFSLPRVQGVCPYGAVETLIETFHGLLVGAGWNTAAPNFWVLLGSLGATVIIGATFCGWLCPLGSIQDWFFKIGRKIRAALPARITKNTSSNFVSKIDMLLGYLRYVVLGLLIFEILGLLFYGPILIDPYPALIHSWTGYIVPISIVVLSIILVLSIFVYRPWCRWLCPFGAVQGLAAKISPWSIRRNSTACISCSMCKQACPMNIAVDQVKTVRSGRCNRCTECLAVCPKPDVLTYSLSKNKHSEKSHLNGIPNFAIKNPLLLAVIVVLLFSFPIWFAYTAGFLGS